MIFDYIDDNKNKHISFKEFRNCFKVVDKNALSSLSTRTLSALSQVQKYNQEVWRTALYKDSSLEVLTFSN